MNALMLYGNYSVMLSLGPQAPFWAGGYYLAPYNTRQAEIGAKYEPGQRILLYGRAVSHARALLLSQGDRRYGRSELRL